MAREAFNLILPYVSEAIAPLVSDQLDQEGDFTICAAIGDQFTLTDYSQIRRYDTFLIFFRTHEHYFVQTERMSRLLMYNTAESFNRQIRATLYSKTT